MEMKGGELELYLVAGDLIRVKLVQECLDIDKFSVIKKCKR